MENNRIDIRDFKAVSHFKITNGIFKKVEKSLEGKEIEFYNLDKGTRDRILKEKDIDKSDNISFLYKIIPAFSNVDMTVSENEFRDMCQAPSVQFANYIDLLMENIKEVFETAVTLSNMENKMIEFANRNGIEIPKIEEVTEPVKSNEEILEELYTELEACGDRAKIKEVMAKINELEKAIEKEEINNVLEESGIN